MGEFRDYVRTLKKALDGDAGDGTKHPSTVSVRLRLPAEAGAVLEWEVRVSGKDASEVVSGLLLQVNLRRLRACETSRTPRARRKGRLRRASVTTSPPTPSLLDLAEKKEETRND